MSNSNEGPTPAAPFPTDPLLNSLLDGRYRLETLLGRGGMGSVYRGLDTRLERPVAIKVLRDSGDADEARFAAEVRTLARFAHPNLVRLLDAGEIEGRPYLVMDLVEGSTLAERLANGSLSSEETAKVGAGVAAALAYVHKQGIVHRDVKPANVLLDRDGTAHLADFGIARLVDTTGITATGFMLGTPAYLAPEQIQGSDIGPAADIYALGLMLLECLSGHRAFEGTASEITAARLQRDPAIPTELDTRWQRVLRSMTARVPAERPGASEAATELADRVHNQMVASVPTDVAQPIGETTAVLRDPRAAETQRINSTTAVVDETLVAPLIQGTMDRRTWSSLGHKRLAIGLMLGAIGLLLGLIFGGVFTGPRSALPRPGIHTGSTAASSTTSTTTTSTTTTLPTLTVASAAGGVVSALDADVTNGSVALPAEQQLTNLLQLLLISPNPASAQQQDQQFDQLVQAFDQDVANGQITGQASIAVLTSSIDGLATALGTSVPSPTTTSAPSSPGPPGNGGKGPGHGGGPGHGH
jgi:serine/threonine protein kinase